MVKIMKYALLSSLLLLAIVKQYESSELQERLTNTFVNAVVAMITQIHKLPLPTQTVNVGPQDMNFGTIEIKDINVYGLENLKQLSKPKIEKVAKQWTVIRFEFELQNLAITFSVTPKTSLISMLPNFQIKTLQSVLSVGSTRLAFDIVLAKRGILPKIKLIQNIQFGEFRDVQIRFLNLPGTSKFFVEPLSRSTIKAANSFIRFEMAKIVDRKFNQYLMQPALLLSENLLAAEQLIQEERENKSGREGESFDSPNIALY